MRKILIVLLGLVSALGGCSLAGPDGPGGSCDHAWSSRDLTRLACSFDQQ